MTRSRGCRVSVIALIGEFLKPELLSSTIDGSKLMFEQFPGSIEN